MCTNNISDLYHVRCFLSTFTITCAKLPPPPLSLSLPPSLPLQTILASDVALTTGQRQLRTFGWSLTSGVDVDNNQYLGN